MSVYVDCSVCSTPALKCSACGRYSNLGAKVCGCGVRFDPVEAVAIEDGCPACLSGHFPLNVQVPEGHLFLMGDDGELIALGRVNDVTLTVQGPVR